MQLRPINFPSLRYIANVVQFGLSANEPVFEWYKFRHSLADAFSLVLQRNRGNKTAVKFEIVVSAITIHLLFSFLAGEGVDIRPIVGRNRSCRILRTSAISAANVPRIALQCFVADPSILNSLLGMYFILYKDYCSIY